ncbi:SpoIIE family protein phosphatase [Streptomyces sp. NPDC001793]|uniref:SpoIIE family protein phosphatase n=1 Tax=Streptomyces sp. NPDC001793 TaxID=3154657 RepID=UPI003320D5CF
MLCRLDAETGVLCWVNCGHPPPLLIRAERVLDGALDSPPQLPIGLHAILDHQRNQLLDDAAILLFEQGPQRR